MHESYRYIPLTNVEQQVKREAGFTMSSPLLFDLLGQLDAADYHEILDILPASQGIIDLFSQHHCKLYLPGCLQDLYEMNTDKLDTANKLNRAFIRNLGLYKNHKAQLKVIFLWDLPNYLDKRVMASLIDYLLPHMDDKVKLHIYIHTVQQMPSQPGIYSITKEGKVWVEDRHSQTVPCPLYYQEALQELLYPFKVKRSILLSSGLQEYILEL